MGIITESLEYKINALKETGTGIWQNIFNRKDVGSAVDGLTSFLEIIDKVTEKLGLFGTLAVGGGLFFGAKSIFSAIKGLSASGTELSVFTVLAKSFPILQDAMVSMAGAASSGAGAFGILSAGATGLWGALAPLLPMILAIGAALASFKAFDYFNSGWTRAQESAEKATDEFNKAQASLEKLQNQQKDNMSQVEQIGAKYDVDLSGVENINEAVNKIKSAGGISLIDEAELDKIARANTDLETQIRLQQEIANATEKAMIAETSAAANVEKSYWEEVKDRHGKGFFGTIAAGWDYLNTTHGHGAGVGAMPSEQGEGDKWRARDTTNYGLAKTALEDYLDARQKLNDFQEDDTKSAQENQEAYRELSDTLADQSSKLSTYMSDLSSQAEILSKGNAADQQKAKEYRDLINEFATIDMTSAEKSLYNLNSFFDGSVGTNAIKDQLEQAAISGENLESVLASMGLSLNDLGVDSLESLNKYFEDAKKSAEEAKDATDDYRVSIEDVANATIEAGKKDHKADQDDNWKTFQSAYKSAKDLLKEGKTGLDDFQTVAQFLSPQNLKKQAEAAREAGGYAADVYQKAFQKAQKTADRWFGEDETESMKNFVDDMAGKKLFKVDKSDGEGLWDIQTKFSTTAEAAKEFGVSIETIETMLNSLGAYGYDFSGVERSAELFSEYQTTLQSLKDTYDSMEEGAGKDRLGKLIEGFDEEYEKFDEDLTNLTKEQVIHIKFEYDLATLQADIESVKALIEGGDNSVSNNAQLIATQDKYISKAKEGLGLNQENVKLPVQFEIAKESEEQLKEKLKDTSDPDKKLELQAEIENAQDIQKQILDTFAQEHPEINAETNVEKINSALSSLDNYKITIDAVMGSDEVEKYLGKEEGATISFKAVGLDGVEHEVDAVRQEDGTIEYTAEINGEPTEADLNKKGEITYETKTDSDSIKAETKTGTTKWTNDTGDVDSYASSEKKGTGKVTWSNDSSAVDSYASSSKHASGTVNWSNNTSNVKTHFTATGTVNWSGGHGVNGTARARGTARSNGYAFARGNWGAKGSGTALMGELGREIIVSKNGRWYTVGDSGAEFVKYNKGDIVFNHEQSKQLLENGAITHGNRRANALMGGTAFRLSSSEGNTSSSKSSSSSKSKGGKSSSKSGKKGSSSSSSSKKDNAIDWIERKLTYFANKVKDIADTITDYVTSAVKKAKLTQERNAISKELTVNEKAYDAYMKAASGVKLSSKLKKKVRSGSYNIKKYGKDTQDKISKYKDYYDKAEKAKQKVTELRNEQLKLFEELMNIPAEQAKKKIDKLKESYDALSASLSAVSTGLSGVNQLLSLNEASMATAQNNLSSAQTAKDNAKSQLTKASKALTKKDKKAKKNSDGTYQLPKDKKSASYKRLKAYNDALKKSNSANSAYKAAQTNYNQMKTLYSLSGSGTTYTYQNALIDAETANLRQQNSANQTALTKANENLSSAQSASASANKSVTNKANAILKKKIGKTLKDRLKKANGGKISTKNLKGNDLKYAKEYNKLVDQATQKTSELKIAQDAQATASSNAAESQAELAKQVVEAEKDKFDNVKKYYEAQNDYLDAIKSKQDAVNDLKQAKGLALTASDYNSLLSTTAKEISNLQSESASLKSQLQSSVSSGIIKEGSEEWKEMQNQIASVEKATLDAQKQQVEYNNAIAQLPFDKIEKYLSYLDSISDLLDVRQDLKTTKGYMLEVSDYYATMAENTKKQAEYQNLANEALANVSRANANGGVYGGKTAQEWQTEANGYISSVEKMTVANEELKNSIKQLPFDKMEKQLDYLKSLADYNDSIRNLNKSRGEELSESDYYNMISDATSQILENERGMVEAYSNYTEAVRSGENVGGKSAQEWLAYYYDLSTEANELRTNIEEIKDDLRDDVYWRTFERAHESCERLSKVLSGINDLIDDNSLFDKNGNLTNYGIARIGNLVKSFETARKEVDNYANDLANLNKLYSQGSYTELEYNEKLSEIQENMLKSASDMKSYQDTIIDMYKNIAQSELDALNELIDKREESLRKKKEYYEYDKNIRKQNEDLQALQAQLAALEGINTLEAKAKKRKLELEISEKQEDLNDTVQDHIFDLSQDALDELKNTLQDAFDEKWDKINNNLDDIVALMASAEALRSSQMSAIGSTLNTLLGYYGISASSTGINAAFASGTTGVSHRLRALIGEDGSEIATTKSGLVLTLDKGDGVIPHEMTDNLMKMAQGILPNIPIQHIKTPDIDISKIGETNVEQHYDSLIHIDGSADAATVEDIKRMTNDLLDKSYKYTSQKIHDGYIKAGGRRKV